jgi:hypothetical protein
MYYEVGMENVTPFVRFDNRYLAAHHAATNNLDMRFNMYDSAFTKCDWSKRPSQSWDELLDIRAHQIAAKGKPIVLQFSGGTDSYTIYKVFERNNIHIDALFLRRRPDQADVYKEVMDLFTAGLYDKTTKIIVSDDYDKLMLEAYDSPDWIWSKGAKQNFGMLGGDGVAYDYVSKIIGTDDYISIVGFEKPRLRITTDGVYSYQADNNYGKIMGYSGIDCFYISPDLPELHIKQSYMMLDYIKSKCQAAVSPADVMHYNDMHHPTKFHWHEYSINACGRFGDINVSPIQHVGDFATTLIIPESGKFTGSEYTGRPARWFQSLFNSNRLIVDNYLSGYIEFLNDAAGKFLVQGPDKLNMRQFNSIGYKLKFNE